jgi:type II secretory pathway component PulC
MLVLFIPDIFATPSNLDAINELLASEKTTPADEIIRRPDMTYKAQELRDPFEPYSLEKKEQKVTEATSPITNNQQVAALPSNLTIQGIVWGGNFPQAIINNKVLKIGEVIEGASIKAIDKDGVIFILGGREYKLPASVSKGSP